MVDKGELKILHINQTTNKKGRQHEYYINYDEHPVTSDSVKN